MDKIVFELNGKVYSIPAVEGYDAKYVRFPDGNVVGILWSETFPPTVEAVHTQTQDMCNAYSDAIMATEIVKDVPPKCSLTSSCREPQIRGGRCLNCDGWTNDE